MRIRARSVLIRVMAGLVSTTSFASTVAAQQPSARVYRLSQGGMEVGRESYRRVDGAIDRSVVIPLLNVRVDSRANYDSHGKFLTFAARVFNATGDSLRATYSLVAEGDSLILRVGGDSNPAPRVLHLRIDGVVPAQSVSIVAEAAERANGRDTVFRFMPMGLDSTIPLTVHYQADVITVTTANIPATLLRSAGAASAIDVPVQRLRADVWNGRDTLPPLRGMHRPAPDYAAPAGTPFTAEEVRIPVRTAAGDTLSLAGTLTLPVAGPRPFPVVVTVSGSGRQPRDEDLWPIVENYRPFRQMADRLARAGIGVLRFDDRGVGGSTGGLLESTTADHADEVTQLVAWLRTRSDVDARRIAVLGHSEGGAIGPLVAARDPQLAGLVLLAGPGKSGREILRDQFRFAIENDPTLSDSARQAGLAGLEKAVSDWAASNSWTRWFDTYDPLAVAHRVRTPVLILQGALDRQVTAGQADTLAVAFRAGGNHDVTVKVYPGLNHLFLRTNGNGAPSEYATLKDTALPAEVLDLIAEWLSARFRK